MTALQNFSLGSDPRIVSGESGAVTIGSIIEICRNNPELRTILNLNAKSRILAVSTEGDTDPELFKNVTQ